MGKSEMDDKVNTPIEAEEATVQDVPEEITEPSDEAPLGSDETEDAHEVLEAPGADEVEAAEERPVQRGPQPVETWSVSLPKTRDGTEHAIEFFRFGDADARPKTYIQAGLHADELPGGLVARYLMDDLRDAAERGEIDGQIVVVPSCNPIGLAQEIGGYMQGRVEAETGRNFNRGFPDLAALARRRVVGKFDIEDAEKNVAKIRKGMIKALDAVETDDAFEAMQTALMREACDADIVLDLHADNEALMHLYTQPCCWPGAEDLAAEIDARAVLLAADSGGSPFDEACATPWRKLREKQPDAAIPQACFSATVELRSNNHVDPRDARRDARGLYRFLMRRGVISGDAGVLPRLLCDATALTAMQQVTSPITGLVVYKLRLGDTVRTGDVIAEIIPHSGDPVSVEATTDGVLFARHDQKWAWDGKVIGKVAGQEPLPEREEGNLLSP